MILRKLVGESETKITGELKGWSSLDRLHRLPVPCLFIAGDDDTVPCVDYERLLASTSESSLIEVLIASTSESSLIEVLILKGAGHGPFYGPWSDSIHVCILKMKFEQPATP
jgi:pimeloyl-ACP methyl ester carboxylesterase